MGVFRKVGGAISGTGKFVGRKIKDGAVHLYENKDEMLLNLKDKIEKEKEHQEKKVNSYENSFENYNEERLRKIIQSTSSSHLEKVAAKRVLKNK